jgi:DNA helicase II / ATP-dependent DNA helicase PcrA
MGRLIAVGDSQQGIFGFTGADNDALEIIARQFKAIKLPLTVSYRCPKAVVRFAHKWVAHIEAAETASEGEIAEEEYTDTFLPEEGSAILSRITKPLVTLAFSFIRRRIACKIEGRDIGAGLIKLSNKWKTAKTIDAFEVRLDAYFEKQTARLNEKPAQLQSLTDQVDTLRAICNFCREEKKYHMVDVVKWIEDLFADGVKGRFVLSTIHKSKGREWNTVYWLNRQSTCPSRFAVLPWMVEQERHLCYVAATRSMNRLVELSYTPPQE